MNEKQDSIDQQKNYPLEINSNEPETICRDCAFSVYDGDTQTGCLLGKIDKFDAQDTEILEVYDDGSTSSIGVHLAQWQGLLERRLRCL